DDLRLLTTLASSLSVALENARLVHETRQRNAELALINSVQESIAGELDQQAIYDLVGEKLREVFDAQVVDIAVHDEAEGILRFVYQIERGVHFPNVTFPVVGFRKHVLETREPLAVLEDMDAALGEYDNPEAVVGEPSHGSAIFQPLVVGGRATGVISIQNLDHERAFSDSDQRLLSTIAGSLGVALENAQLVHETRQRNAELALINSVQEAIAGELDPQAIYDLVGDRIRDVFDAQVVGISMYDEVNGVLEYPYVIEKDARLDVEPTPVVGFRKHVMATGEPLMINENATAEAERYGNPVVMAGDAPKSDLFVPLVVGGRSTGVISLQNVDREHAFTEADQRLLVTLAGSVSVALENARLVHETRRRAEELATVNSVGQALAAQLDLDALIQLVGERVRETFDADIAYVALHDEPAGKIDFAYYYESGERRDEPAIEYGQGLTSHIIRSREPLLLNREAQYEGRAQLGTPSRSYLGVPILVGDEAIGVVSVQSIDEEGRFGEAETGLLATIASNVGVAIHNARLFAEIGRQKQYLESLVAITPVAVVTMDADERVTGWNPAAAELFGHTAAEALGVPVDDLVFGEDARDEGREITREALAGGRAQRITRRRRKDGTAIDVELMLVPLAREGERSGLLAIYHDITELQQAREEAEAATQAKSAFLATMSHEIRTPMNAVIGMTGLLLDTELSPEQREFAEVVRSSGDALLHVIDDILDYSKIEAGKLELEREPVDLRECVEGALEIVAPRAWEKAIELGCLIDEAAPAGIVGDAGRLRQVLLNLLSNAVKFTEEGEVVVDVAAAATGAGSYRLDVAVRDTGIGIPQDRMDKLFESFSQVDASTTRRYGGTGLGLAISKRLVGLMGGTMRVESIEGEGSTFRITLPVQAADVPAHDHDRDALPQLAGKRVLVVDDNATNREIVARHVRSWGMEPVAFATPADALARIDDGEPFDVGVLDMMMPVMDGLALARELRRRRDVDELPLVLLTSLGRLPKSESAGDFAVQLAKPVRASQLYNALVKALAARAPEPAPDASPQDGAAATSPLRILLAEDNAVNQKVALRLLDRLGYHADVVWNGREAIEAIERKPYDVVLMDVQMPELDGLDASRRICERWTREERPRIVAMTANAMPEDREACLAAGMDDYVAKPIRPDALAEALRRVRPRAAGAGTRAAAGLEQGALESLRELGGDAFLGEVIETFLADAPSLLETLRRAVDEGNAEELRRAAHTLKSNGATLGAEAFADRCRTLEQHAKSGRLGEAAELVPAVEQAFEQLRETLASLRPEPVS
ncbi:MAG TPA: GAF domain-containing protein, partial [Gaiellaceae bacterium]|nr:GAF domain-containing protein [Gaiellaceae bacterium]